MKARRNKKQVPSFRKLLKTSKVKLENKLKNKQHKQQSTLKKYRKEQRKLRQAVKDAVSKKPIPLEDPKRRRPVKRIEKEEEEEEEALPLDMLDEDDLQLMKDLGQRASFLTRDLSSSEPVHVKKRKHEHIIDKYEKIPRTLQTAPEKELIHLLPIKDKSGIIPQTREKPDTDSNKDEEDQEEETELEEEIIEDPIPEMTREEHLIERKKKLQEKKLHIATLASAILSDPESNIKKLKELRSMLMEQDPDVAVTVRKLVVVSLMELFKDITPSYKIRPLTEAEKSTKIRKETQKLREFEEGLVSQYKFYLENLEQMVKDWKQRKLKKSNVVSLKAYKGLAEVAVKSLCELLVTLPHFNFHNNIIVLIVPLMNDTSKSISEMCCEAVKKLFKQDKLGQASLGVVKVISGFVKGRNYEVRPEPIPKKQMPNVFFDIRRTTKNRAGRKILFNFRFAHLINVEFFDDLLVVLHTLIESGDLSYQESLHCVQTAFHILSGQGDVLNIDPMKFYTHLYKTLFKLHAGATNDSVEIVLQCLDVMLTKRRKQVSQQRALAFIKRLCTLALQVLPNSSIGILATTRILMHTFPKTDLLLDNESQGSGVFLPELDEPEYCNAQNTALWELHALRRHYHPIVQRFAAHLMAGAPSEGSEALKPELSRRSAVELFETYSMAAMTFNPPVESSNPKKKDKFLQGDSFLNEDLNELVKRHCSEVAIESPLDFTKYLKTSLRVNEPVSKS
uniref:Nucleolar complex protein 3 homolog n=1 Tax=Marmota marmota marmota TaxID=9994 RepID=A0A8C6EVW1_MARMA